MILKISSSQGLSIKKFNGGHLVFSRWPKINSVCPPNNMKTNLKFEVDWGNGFKDIAFTSTYNFKQYIYFKNLMSAILIVADVPKSIASVL